MRGRGGARKLEFAFAPPGGTSVDYGDSTGKGLLYFLLFAKLGSATAMQRSFRARSKKPPPCRTNLYRWYKSMEQEGCIPTKERAHGGQACSMKRRIAFVSPFSEVPGNRHGELVVNKACLSASGGGLR
jgi:hypothetical protein